MKSLKKLFGKPVIFALAMLAFLPITPLVLAVSFTWFK
jgi:hypothetical protein